MNPTSTGGRVEEYVVGARARQHQPGRTGDAVGGPLQQATHMVVITGRHSRCSIPECVAVRYRRRLLLRLRAGADVAGGGRDRLRHQSALDCGQPSAQPAYLDWANRTPLVSAGFSHRTASGGSESESEYSCPSSGMSEVANVAPLATPEPPKARSTVLSTSTQLPGSGTPIGLTAHRSAPGRYRFGDKSAATH